MRTNARSHSSASQQSYEHRVGHFIRQHLDLTAYDGPQSILLVAHSAASPVARAMSALSAEIGLHHIGVRAIVASEDGLDLWLRACPGDGAAHGLDLRVARNPRLLDAHEQLVLGQRAVWFGDSMRRDPLKRDAYQSFLPDDPGAARRARSTFEKLWLATQPVQASRLQPTCAAA